ncbi:MAG: amino acid adenylation domain-containing protein, partial [Candidatus Aminicenantes bacterium]
LKGNPEVALIERSFQQLIKKHEAFRTGFRMIEGDPVQTIQDRVDWKLEYEELKNKEMAAYVKEFKREFDLSRPPMLRITILKVEKEKYLMLVDMHHIIADGVSTAILVDDLAKAYEGRELEPLTIQYKDYAVWQQEWLAGAETRKQEAYWLKRYQGEIPVLNLHTDYPRPQLQSFAGSQCDFRLSQSTTSQLKQICQEYDVTLYMILLACYQVLLAKYSGQDDVVVGSPVAGRDHADTEGIVGMFANTLAFRSQPAGEKEFSNYLAEIKQISIEAYENQGYPFEELVEKVEITRDVSRNPLFDTMFVLQNIEMAPLKMGDIEIMPYRNEPDAARFDLIFIVNEFTGEISFIVEYCTRLFKEETINRLFMHYRHIVEEVLEEPGKKILAIEMVTPGEKEELLYDFNDTRAEYPANKTLQQLFEEQVVRTPDNIAVVAPTEMKYRTYMTYMTYISYRELNKKSNQMAYLLKERGALAPGIIGIMVDRSIEMITGILGILKAGSAYLPIDSAYPEERILLMLADSGTSMLLTQGKIIDRLSVTSLKNMKTRAGHQELVVTPAQTQIKNFDGLPRPDRTLVDYEKYHQYIGIAMAKHRVSLQATRGCPFHCAYCHKIWPNNHIIRSAENILKEIWPCYHAGVRRFVFIDDIFNLDKKKSAKIFESIIKQGMDLQLFFPNGLRGDILTKDFIDLMMEAGTVNIALALESASPRIQELIRKNLNLEKFEENVRYIIKKYPQLLLELEMMIGFPTETEKEALMTLEFLESLKWIHFPNLHILKIYPNTDMYKLALENGIKEELIERSVRLAYHELPRTLPFSKTFVRQYQTRLMNDYFFSKERLLQLLPFQTKILTRDEFVQKYDSYLPMKIKRFSDILDCAGISKEELGSLEFLPEDYMAAPDFRKKISKHFPSPQKTDNPFRILLLDLSLFFSEQAHTTNILYDVIEEPLGLMYLVSFLNEKFNGGVWGKIAKSRIDFDSFAELKTIISDFKPNLIGIRTLSYYREFFHNAVLRIRQWGIDVPIVAGGPYATSDYKYILKDQHVDVVVLGEGELTLAQLVEKMMENNRQLPGEEVLREIPGIAFAPGANKANQWNQAEKNRNILLLDEITGQMTQYPAENSEHMNQPDDLLYVIYTSGSTGKPKGVMLEHGNLVNLIYYQYNYTDIDFSRVLQFTTISFDVSAQEIFSTLLAGGRLSLVAKETLANVPALFERVEKDKIKTLFLPASFLKSVINEEDFVQLIPGSVRHVVTAGEQVIINKRFRQYLLENGVYFHNHYGPTETHVVTALTLDPAGNIPELPSIGKPVSNTGIYMLDKAKHLLPIGVPGELYIGGTQVGRGYLNNPQLTNKKFCLRRPGGESIAHGAWRIAYGAKHFAILGSPRRGAPGPPRKNFSLKVPLKALKVPGKKIHMSYTSYIYKTGDLAKWLPDGNIEFLGRIDHQVKIRGFRVELGEIESRLLNHPGIKDAVVQARVNETGERYLCAYIAPQLELSVSELAEYLSRGLPGYMIPSYFVQLDKIPLTPNGKIDRKALPAPGMEAGDHYKAPQDETEKKLTDIWSEILGIKKEKISVDANFFHLGGHSLKATVLFSRVHKEFNVNIPLTEIFNTPHIRGLAAYIKESGKSKYIPIEAVEKKDYYPLSSAQRRLYILQQIDEEQGIGYNIPSVWQLEGNLDAGKFAAVFQRLIRRHESLRTFFTVVNDEPVQRIKEENYQKGTGGLAPLLIEPAVGSRQLAANTIKNFIRPFDLARAPLLRVGLMKLPHTPSALRGHPSQEGKGEKYLLMVDMHHIISDGVSIDIFIKEFIDLYAGKRLPALRLQYKDYSGWQNLQVQGERFKQQETYWIKEFSGQVQVLDLPTDFSRPSMQSFAGGSICFETGKKETAALKSLAQKQNVTLFMLLLSIYNVFLFKLSGQEDIVVGTPIAGRRHTDLEAIIGMFVNTLALRNFPPGQITFTQFLQAVKERTIKAFDHQDYLYEDLVEQVTVERDTGRNPLFDTMFALQNADTHEIEIPGLNVTPYLNETPISKFDLTLTAVERQENLFFTFEYCSKLFKKETIQRFIGYFNRVISRIVENETIKLSGIEIIDEKEKNRILYEFNNTAANYPKDKTIHELFEEQVEQTPDHAALVGKLQITNYKLQTKYKLQNTNYKKSSSCYLSYKELNEKAGQLAYLLKERSVRSDTIVAIMMGRSIEMIIGILGILKSGSAYLPIDPEYPRERIDYMLTESSAQILLTDNLSQQFNCQLSIVNYQLSMNQETPTAAVLSNPQLATRTSHLAYLIYTSGSTGKPKGVMIGHKAVNNFIIGITGQIPFKPGKVLLAVTTICFDIHILETLVPLCRGMRVVVADEQQQRDGNLLAAAVLKHHIDMLQVTPSRLRMLPGVGHGHDVSCLKHLKEIMVGGEPFPVELLEKLKKLTFARIYNMYGPTETTVWSAVEDLTHVEEITIGRPIANTQIYILNKNQNLQPVGVAGELCIGGDGIAWGYINQPGLTCEKFDQYLWECQDYHDEKLLQGALRKAQSAGRKAKNTIGAMRKAPCAMRLPPGRRRQKIYKTGDLARWLMDGRIEFFGRIDNQVKIRGFRIELGEIESQLLAHEKIKEAVVIAREDSSSNKCLCAYIVLMHGESIVIDQTEFRGYLTNRLPDYMVPSFFVHLDKIPLTPNGKIDRKALPAPEIKAGDNYEPPRSELEERLVEIWQEVLGVEQVGINDNFFQLGGHSLKAIQIVSLFEKEGIRMNVGDLFRYGNIKTLVEIKSVPREPFQENEFIEQTVEKVEHCSEEEKENILEMLEKSIREFSDAILEGKVIKCYPLSAMQKAYLRLSRRSAGTLMAFNGYPDQDRLCKAIIKTTAEQGLLRSRMKKKDSDLLWYEHEMPENLQVPFVDLSHYGMEAAEEITRVITARYFLNRDINVTILPYRVILIKKNMRDHLVVFAADHTIYDALTGQVLKTNLENFYHHGEAFVKMRTPTIRGYDEYVNQVNKGPQQVNQDKIIRTFELEEFKNSMAEVNRVFKANRSNRFVNHEITIPLKYTAGHFDDKMPLEISLRIYVSLCKVFFGIEKVPLLFFSFGRKYQDKEFFDTVGEFTDLVPILVSSNENILAKIEEKIAFASKHNINFMSTLMSEEMSVKWKKVTDLLSPGGIGYDWNLLRFNFTGKTGDIELERVKESSKNMEIRGHPPINDVELDGITVMASYNNERLKIEVGFNMEVDQAEFRESIREIIRQIADLKDLTLVCQEDDDDKNIKR